MKNTFGHSVQLTIFGESHGPAIGASLTGMAPGLEIDEDFIRQRLALRAPQGQISTSRREADEFQIISGVFQGRTTGTPITIIIPNTNTRSQDYARTADLLRPGHADFSAHAKYHGFQDYRGGGQFSGRITAALVAVASICEKALLDKGIIIASHIKECAGVQDKSLADLLAKPNPQEELRALNKKYIATIDDQVAKLMEKKILEAKSQMDSVGGILETVVLGLEAGLGEPYFDSIESQLAHALFSIPAIKGVAFGDGFNFARLKGSQANDSPQLDQNGQVTFASNHNGGINGGITNGMPILFSSVIKPTPSIAQEQATVDFQNMEDARLAITGRHDPAIIHRVRQVVNSITALVICDFLALRHGTDFLALRDEE